MASRTDVGGWCLVAYFFLAYVLSWGAVVAVVGLDGFPAGASTDPGLFVTVVVAQFVGPVVGGLGLVLATAAGPDSMNSGGVSGRSGSTRGGTPSPC